MNEEKVISSITNFRKLVAMAPYGELLSAIMKDYVPLVLELPNLRNDTGMMKARMKTVGESGIVDVVTVADIYIQEQIKRRLVEPRTDWQFWGEEGDDAVDILDTSKKFLLIVDPIEGTNNFRARKDDQWGSVLSLVEIETQEPIIGIVAHPIKRRFYIGMKGSGAYVIDYDDNGEIESFAEMSQGYELEEFTYNNSPHFDEPLIKQVNNFFALGKVEENDVQDELERSRKRVIIGQDTFLDPESGALEAVRNRGAICFKTSNEMAAVFVILGELGGKVTNGDGNPWQLGINTLITARSQEDYDFLKSIYDKTKDFKTGFPQEKI